MIVLQGGRRSGKTTELIKQAHGTGAGILLSTKEMALCVKQQAEKMGYKDIQVFSYNDILNRRYILDYGNINKLYIDELPMFLRRICGINVELVTGDIECIPLRRLLNEIKGEKNE